MRRSRVCCVRRGGWRFTEGLILSPKENLSRSTQISWGFDCIGGRRFGPVYHRLSQLVVLIVGDDGNYPHRSRRDTGF